MADAHHQESPAEYVLARLEEAISNGTTSFNFCYRPYTDALSKLVVDAYFGKINVGFTYKGYFFDSSGDLLICLGAY